MTSLIYDNYLNIADILAYEVFGSSVLMFVVFLGLLVFGILKYNIPKEPGMMLIILFGLLFFIVFPTDFTKLIYIVI